MYYVVLFGMIVMFVVLFFIFCWLVVVVVFGCVVGYVGVYFVIVCSCDCDVMFECVLMCVVSNDVNLIEMMFVFGLKD